MSNAATWRDFTFYWETLSSDKLELAMQIEADRMVNSLLDPKELEAERIVVRSELEGDENDPESLVFDELYSLAFHSHPYQWPVIGRRHDIENITRHDLYKYYKTYYQPNNATVVIVGDFETDKAIAMVKKYFGKIPAGPKPPAVTAKEEKQFGERRAEIKKAGAVPRVMIGFHTPGIGNPDIYALDVIEVILSGGTSSRLYKALVDKQLATSAWASSSISKDPNLFILGATARDGVKISSVEASLLAEVERLKNEPVSDEELQKALNQLEASFIYTNDSVTNQARQLGYFETIFSWRFVERYLENVRKVTKADIKRIAQKYFTEKNRTVVTFIPEERQKTESSLHLSPKLRYAAYRQMKGETITWAGIGCALPHDPCMLKDGLVNFKQLSPFKKTNFDICSDILSISNQSSDKIKTVKATPPSIKPLRVVLDNGIVIIIHENRSNPTVGIQGSLNAGSAFDPAGKSGLAQMTAKMLMKGTTRRTADQIARDKDFVGMSLDTDASVEFASFTGYALSKHFDKLLDLLSDVIKNPTFPNDEFEKMKASRLSSIKQEEDNPESLAFRTFKGTIFPPGHPYHALTIEEELANTSAITRDDIVSFYKSHYGPKGMILVVVGDVDAKQAVEKIQSYFADWNNNAVEAPPIIPDVPLQTKIEKKIISMPDKSQTDVILGHVGELKRRNSDFYAATVMNFVLGGGGTLGSRLGDEIRDKLGLVYDVYSTFEASLGAGPWYAKLGTNPKNTDKAIKALTEQITLMRDKGAKKEEVQAAIDYITGVFPVRLEKNSSIANILWAAEFYGLGMDYIQNYQKLYRSVTVEQVNAMAKKYLHPDSYTLVIAGPYLQTSESKNQK
ncbi:MAG: pitrilysin family protein [Armatimonadota bacterium]|nr:pitrilysin family protein [Armatimonadota bacterium]